MSSTQWLPVETTAQAIRAGYRTHRTFSTREVVTRSATYATTTTQPTWKLGIAPRWLVTPGGRATSTKDPSATVSVNASPAPIHGGAHG
jgi:hypothetical protein